MCKIKKEMRTINIFHFIYYYGRVREFSNAPSNPLIENQKTNYYAHNRIIQCVTKLASLSFYLDRQKQKVTKLSRYFPIMELVEKKYIII